LLLTQLGAHYLRWIPLLDEIKRPICKPPFAPDSHIPETVHSQQRHIPETVHSQRDKRGAC